MSLILDLPNDVLVTLCYYFSLKSLYNLSLTCKQLYQLISTSGWTSYHHAHAHLTFTPSVSLSQWHPHARLRYHTIADRNIRSPLATAHTDTSTQSSSPPVSFVARPLAPPWLGRLIPTLALSSSRLVVTAGSVLYVYSFRPSSDPYSLPEVRMEGTYLVTGPECSKRQSQAYCDISTITFLPDGGADRTLLVGLVDGYIIRLTLPTVSKSSPTGDKNSFTNVDEPLPNVKKEILYKHSDIVESVNVAGELTFSLSGSGKGVLSNVSYMSNATDVVTDGPIGTTLDLARRSWCSLLSNGGGGIDPYVAIGSTASTPLSIHTILPGSSSTIGDGSISTNPSTILGTRSGSGGILSNRSASAVYALAHAPPAFPGARPGTALVSGWFDGCVRVYDLRVSSASSTTSTGSGSGTTVLAPVVSLRDRWQPEAIYAVSAGGPTGSTIAAGEARHSVVAFWDIRNARVPVSSPSSSRAEGGVDAKRFQDGCTFAAGDVNRLNDGWSVYAPGNDSSPVYALALAGARCFGATQSRAFVLDFGGRGTGCVTPETYPMLPSSCQQQQQQQQAQAQRPRRRGEWRGLVGAFGRGADRSGLRTVDGVHFEVMVYGHGRGVRSGLRSSAAAAAVEGCSTTVRKEGTGVGSNTADWRRPGLV